MSRIQLIGIAGRAGSGKDTVAQLIHDMVADGAYIRPFALPIKQACVAMFGIPMKFWGEPGLKNELIPGFDVSYRHVMQTIGTDWGRYLVDKDLWLKLAQHAYERWDGAESKRDRFFIVPDVRFENEATWIRNEGILIHLTRPGNTIELANHASEKGVAIDRNDLTLPNNGTLEELRDNVAHLLGLIIRQ
jgi:hypothetical protein